MNSEIAKLLLYLIVAIGVCRIVYSFFENSGFKAGFTFLLFLELANHMINGNLIDLYNEFGLIYFIIFLLIIFIFCFIITGIQYFAYNKTSNFFTYLIFAGILELFRRFCTVVALAYIVGIL